MEKFQSGEKSADFALRGGCLPVPACRQAGYQLESLHLVEYNFGMPGNIEHLNINESNALLKAIDDTRDFNRG